MTKEVHLYASQRVSRRAKDGKDGTSVTIISKSVTYQISASGTETPTGNWSDKVVATTDTKPYLWTRTIVVYSDTNSTTSYSVSYKGKDGAPGKDAYRVEVSPSTLVFDTNEDGVVDRSALSGKYATVTVYKGSQKISVDNLSLPSNYATKKYTNVDGRIYNTNGEARITITEIEQETISGDEKVSKSSGQISFPIDVLGERSTLMWVTVNVQVNVAKFTGSVVANNKKFETKFEEISDRFKNTPTNDDLAKAESRITQTAREISLSVSEKVIGRRNLLVNSAFRNQDSVLIHSLARIEKNTGVDGVNCIHSSDKYSGTGEGNYIGAFWDSTQKNGVVTNIPIVKGKKYVFSCWIKSDNLDLPFIIECLYMKSINQQSRDNVDGAISVAFKVHEKNKWEKISCVLDTNNEKATEYLAVNFWSNNKNVPRVTDATGATYYPTCHAYICKPMMEEGDTYSGWTLSEDDYDYVGGNILDNTRSLEKSGNLKTEDSEIINEGYEYAYAVAHSNNTTSTYIEMLQWNMVGRINDTQDYIFSFLAKGTGVVSTYLWKDGTPRFFVESSNNKHDAVSPDGNVDFKLTNEWKRYWVHYHLNTSSEHPLPENLLIRCYSGNNVYVCQPKLEVGATMTEWTERKTDLVDKASLKAAGIVVDSESVTLYGNQVHIKKNKTDANDTVLIDNETGQVSAGLINAYEVVAKGIKTQELEAQNLNVTGNSRLGIFEIKTSSIDERDQYSIAGDMITYSGSYKLPDGKTDITSIDGLAYLMYKPLFIRQGAPENGRYMRLGNNYTEWDDCGTGNGDSYLFNGASARYVCSGSSNCTYYALQKNLSYNTGYFPVSYIYATKATQNDPAFAINVVKTKDSSDGTRTAIQTNGAIRGVIAPNLRIMNYSGQISSSDCIVIVTKGGITLKLPAGPVVGQTLLIYSKVSSNVYIEYDSSGGYGTGKMYSNGSLQTKIEIGRAGIFTYFIFDGENWCYAYFNGSHRNA